MEMNHYSSAEALLQESNCLISLPEVCIKLRQVLDDPDHTRLQISEIIIHDAALTSRLLRIVNSAYFGLSTQVKDVSHALGILGEKDLNNLVIVTSIVKTMNSINTGLDRNKFWRCSIFSAILARNIAAHFNKSIKEELFIAGLLLNIGQFLIYYREPELLKAIEEERVTKERESFAIETELLGFNHADVGSVMARSWNFSPLLIDSISNHHNVDVINEPCIASKVAYFVERCCEKIDLKPNQEINFEEFEIDQAELLKAFELDNNQFITILDNSFHDYTMAYDDFCGAEA